jgi:hypothetical protein
MHMSDRLKATRAVLLFVGNCLTASIGPAALERPIILLIRPRPTMAAYVREDVATSALALGLGAFVWWKWRYGAAKWTWIVGLCWFLQRALRWRFGEGAQSPHSLAWEMSGGGGADVNAAFDWLDYTIPLLRMSFYSLGAALCSRFIVREPGGDKSTRSPR